MTKASYSGSCLCGAIAFEVDALGEKMGHCHCTMCRKFHGAAFTTFGEAKAADFRWLKGESCLKGFKAENGTERQFCEHCGASLIFKSADSDGKMIEFALGALDTPIDKKPDVHIYTAYKADWYTIADDLPQHRDGRPKA